MLCSISSSGIRHGVLSVLEQPYADAVVAAAHDVAHTCAPVRAAYVIAVEAGAYALGRYKALACGLSVCVQVCTGLPAACRVLHAIFFG